jgi:hypothetical protein
MVSGAGEALLVPLVSQPRVSTLGSEPSVLGEISDLNALATTASYYRFAVQ